MHPDVIPASVLRYMTEKDPEWIQVQDGEWFIYRNLNEHGIETERFVTRIKHIQKMHASKVVALSKDAQTW